jgi:glycosyltransferase involved in cell wall biosynthesis
VFFVDKGLIVVKLVSIIMNCYNGEKYLRQALDSVLAQTNSNWELIFWDNQSTDSSAELFKSYNDSRFKYYYAPNHTLLYEARNYAIEKASGEFLAFLDVDDWWEPDKLVMQVPLFDDKKVGLVCCNYWVVNELRKTKKLFRKSALPNGWVLNDLLKNYFVGLLTLMVRRSAFDGLNGGCNPAYHVIGDFDLVFRLAVDWKIACNQVPLAFYRVHGENEGQKQRKRAYLEYKAWVDEQKINPKIVQLPAFSKVLNEVLYVEGLVYLSEQKNDRVRAIVSLLPWGNYKFKLLLRWWLPRLF